MIEDFAKLGICREIQEVIKEEGFDNPTIIQNKAIPQVFSNRDIIATAKTGSGKTLVYATRIIQNCFRGEGVQAVVIVPTRELAIQVGDVLKKFSKHKELNIMISYGKGSLKAQKEQLLDTDIIVSTTGRLSDYVEQDLFQLGRIKFLVIDEVDSLMQKQFQLELDYIVKEMPKKRQTMVFSATISKEILNELKKYLKFPKRISVDNYVDAKKLKQHYYEIEPEKKLSLLTYFLNTEKSGLSIIFTNRQDSAEFLAKNLKKLTDLKIEVIHGDTSQGKRSRIIKNFEQEKFDVLITTDLAARGLDVDNVSHIYNYNIPKHPEKYIHRIGRTARAGNFGKVINLISKSDVLSFIDVMRDHKVILREKELPQFDLIEIKTDYKKKKDRR